MMELKKYIKYALWLSIAPFLMASSCEALDKITGEIDEPEEENNFGGGQNHTVNIKSGLAVFYPFDNETCEDYTENELDGILYESPIFIDETPNGMGKALFLNINKYPQQKLNIPYNPLKGLTAFSISLWVKDFSAGTFIGVKDGSSWDNHMCFFYRENGRIACTQWNNYEFSGYNAALLLDGNWHMLTYVQVSGNAKLYVDGKLVDSQATRSSEGVDGTRMLVYNHMKLDNLRIYTREINAKEVAEIYKREK